MRISKVVTNLDGFVMVLFSDGTLLSGNHIISRQALELTDEGLYCTPSHIINIFAGEKFNIPANTLPAAYGCYLFVGKTAYLLDRKTGLVNTLEVDRKEVSGSYMTTHDGSVYYRDMKVAFDEDASLADGYLFSKKCVYDKFFKVLVGSRTTITFEREIDSAHIAGV